MMPWVQVSRRVTVLVNARFSKSYPVGRHFVPRAHAADIVRQGRGMIEPKPAPQAQRS